LFYVTNIFIFEETGKKSRETWQCGVELIGENSVIADGELIALALDVLHRLGLTDTKVILSHAGLIRALLEEMELPSQEKGRIFDQILDGDLKTLAYIRPDKPEIVQILSLLLKLKGKSPGLLKNMKVISAKKLPRFKPGLDNFIGVVELLEELDCDYRIDLASGKGFEYYTGIIFHLSIGKEIIGGGGRYDELIPLMGGRDTPAAGFALYLDNLMRIVKVEDTEESIAKMVSITITHETAKEGFKIADMLRKAGMTVELALVGQQTVKCGWFISINTESPIFIITNLVNGRKSAVNSTNDVKALLVCE
jgi:histidyl-tRNA synthetase